MFGVTVLKVGKYLLGGGGFTGAQTGVMVVGFIVSWIVAYFAIKVMMNYIKNNDFKVFGYYRIVVGIVVLALGAAGMLHMH